MGIYDKEALVIKNDAVRDRQPVTLDEILDSDNFIWVAPRFLPHLRFVLKRLSQSDLQKVSDYDARFFAPDPNFLGRVFAPERTIYAPQLIENTTQSAEHSRIVYLSPQLLGKPDDEIHFAIGHEIAHVVLGHDELPPPYGAPPREAALVEGTRDEDAADELARSWGFIGPKKWETAR
jgi:hypothetical protein